MKDLTTEIKELETKLAELKELNEKIEMIRTLAEGDYQYLGDVSQELIDRWVNAFEGSEENVAYWHSYKKLYYIYSKKKRDVLVIIEMKNGIINAWPIQLFLEEPEEED